MTEHEVPDVQRALVVGDEHFEEQFPLSPLDDFLIHQTSTLR